MNSTGKAERSSGITISGLVDAVAVTAGSSDRLSAQTAQRAIGLMQRFATFAAATGVAAATAVTPELVESFTTSPTSQTKTRPSIATMRLRRWAIRLLFSTGRQLNLVVADPTADVELPGRQLTAVRPLTDSEIDACRRAATSLDRPSRAVAWALGEATARTSEILHVRPRDVDLDRARVWIAGASNTKARWGHLTDWGTLQIRRRLDESSDTNRDVRLAYDGQANAESRAVWSAQAIRSVMRRAGIAADPLVRPASLAGWAGLRVFIETHRIEIAADALGVRSLDTAARMVGWKWQTPDLDRR